MFEKSLLQSISVLKRRIDRLHEALIAEKASKFDFSFSGRAMLIDCGDFSQLTNFRKEISALLRDMPCNEISKAGKRCNEEYLCKCIALNQWLLMMKRIEGRYCR